jgi:hypothetical protein
MLLSIRTKTLLQLIAVNLPPDIARVRINSAPVILSVTPIVFLVKAKWTNLSAKGTFGGILVAAEHHKQKAAGTSTNVEQKVTLLPS